MIVSSTGLPCWEEVKEQVDAPSVLLGNGFSVNLHEPFDYKHLFEASDLPPESSELFEKLDINDGNFERALASLTTAESVMTHLNIPADRVQQETDAIRSALIRAVKRVHPEQAVLRAGRLEKIHRNLAEFEHVFTTNYDLLLYWATFGENGPIGDDSFRRPTDRLVYVPEAEPVNLPQIHYLHGGIHLAVQDGDPAVVKTARQGQTHLLDGIEESWSDGLIPLFVCEGSGVNKVATIGRHGYLMDQLRALRNVEGGLLIVGHQLAEPSDGHIVDAINMAVKRNSIQTTVGLYPLDPWCEEQRESIKRRINGDVTFFDSRCHPLLPPRAHPAGGRAALVAPSCPHGP